MAVLPVMDSCIISKYNTGHDHFIPYPFQFTACTLV